MSDTTRHINYTALESGVANSCVQDAERLADLAGKYANEAGEEGYDTITQQIPLCTLAIVTAINGLAESVVALTYTVNRMYRADVHVSKAKTRR